MGESGGPITHDMNSPEVYATVFALGPGKTDVNVIWAGSDDGVVHVTRDGGKTWTNVTPPDMPEFGRVSSIDASAFDAGTAYLAVKQPLLDDFAPVHLPDARLRHAPGRRSSPAFPPTDYVHAVREDPTRRGLLYAGTQHGVYVSFDDGDRWQPLSLNLPDVPVVDLVVEDNDLAIATHGRGFYILDDIGPLRQCGSAVAAADGYLFRPADAIRSTDGATRSLPAEEAGADGRDRDPRQQRIRDLVGVVRAGRLRPMTRQRKSGVPRAPQVSTAPGLHRVTWDLGIRPRFVPRR